MVINKIGQYKLLRDITTRNTISVATLKVGTIINITQIDKRCHKVIGTELLDWIYWNLPAIKE